MKRIAIIPITDDNAVCLRGDLYGPLGRPLNAALAEPPRYVWELPQDDQLARDLDLVTDRYRNLLLWLNERESADIDEDVAAVERVRAAAGLDDE